MPIRWVYAALYFIGIFLLSHGVQGQDMPPMTHLAFGVAIVAGLACIQLSEKS